MAIANLIVRLSADVADFDKKISGVERALQQSGRSMQKLGSQLTQGLTVPLLAIGGGALKAAIDFESSFAGIRKTTSATEAEFQKLAQGMRDLAKTIPVNVNELNKLGESAGQLGIPTGKVLEFTKVMAELGVTTNLTATEAADAIARIQNIFGASGQDTERFASTLVALGNAGASTEKEIVAMSQRIAGAGHTVGLTQAQVLAFASTLASVGINAEAGGSAISRVFLKINDAVQGGGKSLDEFARVSGMSSTAFKKAFSEDAAGATQAFIAGLGRLKESGENINKTIEGLTGKNIILKDTLFRLSGAGSLLSDQLKLANTSWQANTALTKEAEQRFKTTASQLQLLKNQVQDVAITFGTALLPILNDTVAGAKPLVSSLSGLATAFSQLPTPIKDTAVALGLLFASLGPLAFVIGKVQSSWAALLGVIRFIPAVVGAATTGILALTGSLTGVVTGVTGVTGVLYLLQGAFTAVVGSQGLIVGLFVALAAAMNETVKGINNLQRAFQEGHFLQTLFAKDDDNFVRRWLGLSGAVKETANELGHVAIHGADVNLALEKMKPAGKNAGDSLGHVGKSAKEAAKAAKEAAADYLEVVNGILSVRDKVEHLSDKFTDASKSIQDRINGVDLVAQAQLWVEALKETGAQAKILADQHLRRELGDIIVGLTGKFGTLQAAGVGSLEAIAVAMGQIIKLPEIPVKLGIQGRGPGTVLPKPSGVPKLPKGPLATQLTDPTAIARAFTDAFAQAIKSGGAADTAARAAATSVAQTYVTTFAAYLTSKKNEGGLAISGFTGESIKAGLSSLNALIGGGVTGLVSSLKGLATTISTDFVGTMLSFIPGIGPALSQLAGPIIEGAKKLFSNLFGIGTAGRDVVKDFASSLGGFDELHKKILELGEEGERLWVKLTQGVGRNNSKEAQAAVDAVTEALQRHKAAQDQVAESAAAAGAAQSEATKKAQAAIDALTSKIDSLQQSIANEAPEEVMGIIEANTRAQIQAIKDERTAAQAALDQTTKDAADAAKEAGDIIDTALAAREFHIKVKVDLDGLPGGAVPAMASGGIVRRRTLALVGEHGPEAVVPLSRMGRFGGTPNLDVTLRLPNNQILLRQFVQGLKAEGLA